MILLLILCFVAHDDTINEQHRDDGLLDLFAILIRNETHSRRSLGRTCESSVRIANSQTSKNETYHDFDLCA